jgi:hypothetical protein
LRSSDRFIEITALSLHGFVLPIGVDVPRRPPRRASHRLSLKSFGFPRMALFCNPALLGAEVRRQPCGCRPRLTRAARLFDLIQFSLHGFVLPKALGNV